MYVLIGAAAGLVLSILLLVFFFLVWPKKGKLGINTETVFCPECGEKMPPVRTPQNLNQLLWGGWNCPGCGTQMDKYGVKIE